MDRLKKNRISRSRQKEIRKSKQRSKSNSTNKKMFDNSRSENTIKIQTTKSKRPVSRFNDGEKGESFKTKDPEIPSPFYDSKQNTSVNYFILILSLIHI